MSSTVAEWEGKDGAGGGREKREMCVRTLHVCECVSGGRTEGQRQGGCWGSDAQKPSE